MNMHFRSGNWTRTVDKTDKQDNLVDYQDYGYSMSNFDLTLDKIIKGRLNVDDVIKRHRRVRRSVTKKDTIEHVTKIMESIEEELDDLKVIFEEKTSISFSYFECRLLTKQSIKQLFFNSNVIRLENQNRQSAWFYRKEV